MFNESILVVEEDKNLLQSIALILQHAGYQVTTTGTVLEALERIRSGNHQLVILDTIMPETNHFLLPKVEKFFPDIALLILVDGNSAHSGNGNFNLNTYYLDKPIDPEYLLEGVKMMLRIETNHE